MVPRRLARRVLALTTVGFFNFAIVLGDHPTIVTTD